MGMINNGDGTVTRTGLPDAAKKVIGIDEPVRKSGSVRWVLSEEWKPQALAEEKAKRAADLATWELAHPWRAAWRRAYCFFTTLK